MSMFRSAEMKFFTLHVPKEDTYGVIERLASHNFVQFIDSNTNAFHRPYTNSLKRCEEVLNKLKIIFSKVHKEGFELPEVPKVEFVFENHKQYLEKHQMGPLALLDRIEDEVEYKFQSIEKAYRGLSDFQEKINELEDFKHLLFKAREVFHSRDNKSELNFEKTTLEQLRLVNVSGIIESKDLSRFTKMIFRITKGNSVLYTFNVPKEIEYIEEKDKENKRNDENDSRLRTAFICIVETSPVLLNKIGRICESYGVKKYRLPSNKDEIFAKIKEIEDSITDTKQLYVLAQRNYNDSLNSVIKTADFDVSLFDAYKIILEKESMIFHTLNLLEESNSIMIGSLWVPSEKIGLLYSLVPSFVSIREAHPKTKPPTHFESNEFTAPFQEIVNTYGVPRYQEVNPALYAIPIFPFLFGVMFGDIGHGGVLLALGIYMTTSSSAKKTVPFLYGIRFLLLLMGIFAFYSGWIYNEFFSLPLNVFGSCYGDPDHEKYAVKEEDCVYPFGFDPKWFRASNDLNYFNSYKMKFAVIIGVFQMTFAILLKMMNTWHFKSYLDFFFEWIPQQVFFFCTFGYMCILIIYKWTIHWGVEVPTDQAPSIIGQMIAFPLKLGSTEGKPLWDQENQETLQYYLLIISLICVPIMLIPKPLIIWIQSLSHSSNHNSNHNQNVNSDEELGATLIKSFNAIEPHIKNEEILAATHSEEHDISEIAVHQIIETIEFILGSISNTASYLRLWALSLAHGQLSKVFLEKTIGGGIQSANPIIIMIGMYFFFNITLGVIMGMDSLECFLHALRLQWVEFQGKFYKADGWKFEPLSFSKDIQAKADGTRDFD